MKRIGYIITACVLALVGIGPAAVSASAAPAVKAAVIAPSDPSHLDIKEYGWNAVGTDKSSNRNSEFVRVVNTAPAGSDPLNVEGWVIHDTYQNAAGDWGNRFTFRGSTLPAGSPFKGAGDDFVIPAGYAVIVYNGSGVDSQPTNTTAAIYRNFSHHWNNGGDTIYVRTGASASGYVAAIVYNPYRARQYQ